jgi:hypothetical protein
MEYVKLTVPVGVPATDVTVAVIETGWPRVVVVVFAESEVTVRPWEIVTGEADEVEPAFTASPL